MGATRASAQLGGGEGAPVGIEALDDLNDLVDRGNLHVRCRSCWHGAVFCPATLVRWFELNRFDTGILSATRRFRCTFCQEKKASLILVNDPVTVEWLPNNEEQWKFFDRRVRWLRRQHVRLKGGAR